MNENVEKKLRDISLYEWNQYEWADAQLGSNMPIFLKRRKWIEPPDDGYKYVDISFSWDTEPKWVRAKTYD